MSPIAIRARCVGMSVFFTAVSTAATFSQTNEPASRPKPTAEPSKTAAATTASAPIELALEGIKFTVPAGWTREEVEKGPMAPVAVFKIPKGDGPDDGMVRITHYPNMKGKDMDDRNIDRWVGQVAKPDGTPMSRGDAKIATFENGGVKITTVDLNGSVKMTMRDTGKAESRMIAAILHHGKGPHFVVCGGPAKSMEKWAAQIDAFLKSAKVE